MLNVVTVAGGVNLQATLSASSACGDFSEVRPHHPITCSGALAFHDDGTFACEHAVAPPDDPRTRHCLDHSMALLLIELAAADR
jgi:hypothetical protein